MAVLAAPNLRKHVFGTRNTNKISVVGKPLYRRPVYFTILINVGTPTIDVTRIF